MYELEIRSFIDETLYNQIINYYKESNYNIIKEMTVITYFKGNIDFRLLKTNKYYKLYLKEGIIHDDIRKEYEVNIDNKYGSNLLPMLDILGYQEEVKWYRNRLTTIDKDIKITIDYTYGYGHIIEVKNSTDNKNQLDKMKEKLINKLNKLGVKDISSKQIFNEKFLDYKLNYIKYINGIDEEKFLKEVEK